MNNDKGGSAFPDFKHDGMKLRDYFAAKADMTPYNPRIALETKLKRAVTMAELAEYIAKIRHIEADAMLAERAK